MQMVTISWRCKRRQQSRRKVGFNHRHSLIGELKTVVEAMLLSLLFKPTHRFTSTTLQTSNTQTLCLVLFRCLSSSVCPCCGESVAMVFHCRAKVASSILSCGSNILMGVVCTDGLCTALWVHVTGLQAVKINPMPFITAPLTTYHEVQSGDQYGADVVMA